MTLLQGLSGTFWVHLGVYKLTEFRVKVRFRHSFTEVKVRIRVRFRHKP